MLIPKLIAFFLSVVISHALVAEESAYYSDSEYWPQYVELKQRLEISGSFLRADRKAVLIRLIDESVGLVDFGRQGVHEIPLEVTDFAERFDDLRYGRAFKRLPNVFEMLGPRMLKEAQGELETLKFVGDDAVETFRFTGVLFVYLPADLEFPANSKSEFSEVMSIASGAEIAVLVIPQAPISQTTLKENLLGKGLENFYLLYDFVVSGYIDSLVHRPNEQFLCVLTDPDGKVIFREESLDSEKVKEGLAALSKRFPEAANEVAYRNQSLCQGAIQPH